MGYILDGIILLICLLCVLIGVKRGFIHSVVRFLGSIIAALLAPALGGVLAQWLFDTMFRGAMVEKINSSLQTLGADNAAAAASQVLASLPDFLVRALEEAGVTLETVSHAINSQTSGAAGMVVDYLSPVFVNFLKVLAVIVLFFLFMTIVRLLAALVGDILRLPILKEVDGLLGGVFGFLLAMVSVWVVVAGVMVFMPMLDSGTQQQVQEALDGSLLTGVLVNMNPLRGMFQ
ncbi:CvpA family protein [Acutalibacter sp. 1XD8-36]|uniref:CvpA family protein n=1 Tax=Acutalibacter sp. 1XD8-36 TaxID=2320852 RepID=UPI001412117E|nr:CvpA family protein [Acutalibacter sp. 1XD8-36]NBJ88739.1 CvpA family protein [Acutalibacter sp. 1XD8-36]